MNIITSAKGEALLSMVLNLSKQSQKDLVNITPLNDAEVVGERALHLVNITGELANMRYLHKFSIL